MGLDSAVVQKQLEMFLVSTERLSVPERAKNPSAHYATRFNDLLALAKEVAPDIDERLWPSAILTHRFAGQDLARANYIEIDTYVRQILSLIPAAR